MINTDIFRKVPCLHMHKFLCVNLAFRPERYRSSAFHKAICNSRKSIHEYKFYMKEFILTESQNASLQYFDELTVIISLFKFFLKLHDN